MATVGQHVASAVDALHDLRVALDALTAELQAVRLVLETLNGKVPTAVDGKLPALVTANGAMPISVDGALPVTTDQLPATLANGRVRVTGLL
jgi:hypothetical protein